MLAGVVHDILFAYLCAPFMTENNVQYTAGSILVSLDDEQSGIDIFHSVCAVYAAVERICDGVPLRINQYHFRLVVFLWRRHHNAKIPVPDSEDIREDNLLDRVAYSRGMGGLFVLS